jgi:hypothetical protein
MLRLATGVRLMSHNRLFLCDEGGCISKEYSNLCHKKEIEFHLPKNLAFGSLVWNIFVVANKNSKCWCENSWSKSDIYFRFLELTT